MPIESRFFELLSSLEISFVERTAVHSQPEKVSGCNLENGIHFQIENARRLVRL